MNRLRISIRYVDTIYLKDILVNMASKSHRKSRTRNAVLGVLSYGPSTGYEIRKLLSETTAHFWKESYGQIYPTLEELRAEGLIEVVEHERSGRETRRFAILQDGEAELREWIHSREVQLKPGRNELLLKLFFARSTDAPFLIPQVEAYHRMTGDLREAYDGFTADAGSDEIPSDARVLIGTTIDFGIAAAEMQRNWCERTIETLREFLRTQ
jgi:PadR family transcriptional regulator, regulatory protein AphA